MSKTHKAHYKERFDANNDAHVTMMQIHSMLIGPGLPSPAALMFNRPVRGQIPKLTRPLILFDHNDDHYAAPIEKQQNTEKKQMFTKVFHFCLQGQL